MTPAAIYARYSSDLQNPETIAAQLDACTSYCARENLSIVETYTDEAKSGRTEAREGYQRMLADARAEQFAVIVVYKFDRFGRDVYDIFTRLGELRRYGVEVWSSVEGRDPLTRNVRMVLSEAEAEATSVRVLDAMKYAARRGRHPGRAPYGYRKEGGALVVEPTEAPVVRRIFEMYLSGQGTWRIRDQLESEGIPTRQGRGWNTNAIIRILRNQAYTGDLVWNRQHQMVSKTGGLHSVKKPADEIVVVPNNHEALVLKEDWASCQRPKEGRDPRSVYPGKYMLTGLVWCGTCGTPYVHVRAYEGRRHRYACRRYRNLGRKACRDSPTYVAEALERAVVNAMLGFVLDDGTVKRIVDADDAQRKILSGPERKARIERAMRKNQGAIANLLGALREMGHSDAIAAELVRLEGRERTLKSELKALEVARKPLSVARLKKQAEGYRERLRDADTGRIRRILHDCEVRIVVGPNRVTLYAVAPWDGQQVELGVVLEVD